MTTVVTSHDNVHYNNANFHGNKQTLKVINRIYKMAFKRSYDKQNHFILSLLNSPKAHLINDDFYILNAYTNSLSIHHVSIMKLQCMPSIECFMVMNCSLY